MSKELTGSKQVAKNLIYNTISFVINFIIAFFFTPYLIREVGKEAYGFFPLVNNMIGYTSIITTAVGSMAGRFITMRIYKDDINGANRYLNSMWVSNVVLSIIFTLITIVLIVFIDKILSVPSYLLHDVQWLFGLGIFSIVLGLLTGFLAIPAYVRNRIDLSSTRTVWVNLIRIFSIIALFALFKPSIVYMSLSALIASIAGIFFNYNLKKQLLPELAIAPRKYFKLSYVRELTTSGMWNSVNQLSNSLLYQLDLLITNIFVSAAMTGDYAIAKTAPNLILQLLAMLSGTFVAQFNILYAKGEIDQLVAETRKSMAIIGMLISIPIGFLAVFSGDFYNLWVPGQDISLLHRLTFYTVLPMIIGGSINPIFGIFATTNKLKVPSLVVLVAGLVQTLMIVILLKTTNLGIWAIVFVSALQSILRNLLFTPIYGAYALGRNWNTFFPTMLRGIAGMITVVIVGFIVKKLILVDTWFMFILAGVLVSVFSILVNMFIMLKKTEREHVFLSVKRKFPITLFKKIFTKWSIGIALGCCLFILIIPCFYYKNKRIHFSFDDVSICMKELTSNTTQYNSIFEQPFLKELQQLHKSYGAKFTLYVYEKDGDYDISQFPQKFADEFDRNSDWLKVGYHAVSPTISKDSISLSSVFIPSFERVDSILTTKFRSAKSETIRLHYFHATQEEVDYLVSKGVKTLLAADDDRISYSLSKSENSELLSNESFEKNGMTYISTDHRCERDNTLIGVIRNAKDEEMIIFTHEWAYYGAVRRSSNFIIKYLSFYNVNFEN